MSKLQALLDRKAELERSIAERQMSERADAVARILELMSTHGLTSGDLVLAKIGRTPQMLGPKYRNPATGHTWSGRGRRPPWVHEALADGKHLDDFATRR